MAPQRDDKPQTRKFVKAAPDNRPTRLTRTLTYLLDDVATIPGTNIRIGLDPIFSLIPGAGSTASTVLGIVLLTDAARLRIPLLVLVRMATNYLIDWLIGMVPFVGAIGDVVFRANRRNLRLLNCKIDGGEQLRKASAAYWIAASAVILGTLLVVLVLTGLLISWVWRHLAAA